MDMIENTHETKEYGQLAFTDDGDIRVDNSYLDDGGRDTWSFPKEKRETWNILIALLFALSRPASPKEMAAALGTSEKEAKEEADILKEYLDRENGALVIKNSADGYELCTGDRYFDRLVNVVAAKKNPKLSGVLMVTLAIIAGKGRATRADVEKIRGIKSDFAINKLVEYGLIEEKGRLDFPGRPIVFETTEEFRRRFGVWDDSDLNDIDRQILEKLSEEAEKEAGVLLKPLDQSL